MKKEKILAYTVIFERAKEGGYFAYVPLLPGCTSQGETFEETKENIQEAMLGYLSVLQEDGDEIPMEGDEHISATIRVPLMV